MLENLIRMYQTSGEATDKPACPAEVDAVYQDKLILSQVARLVSEGVVIETEGLAEPYVGSSQGELEALQVPLALCSEPFRCP